MRRSKSNPAKYARNYRSISQRQMTQFDNMDEEKEMKRLKNILKHSHDHLKGTDTGVSDEPKKRKRSSVKVEENESEEPKEQPSKQTNDLDSDEEFERARALLRTSTDHLRPHIKNETPEMQMQLKKGKKRNRKQSTDDVRNVDEDAKNDAEEKESTAPTTKKQSKPPNDASDLLSKEFLEEHQVADSIENPLAVLPAKKKPKKKKTKVELTPEEIKQAKRLQKKTERKLQQLNTRAEQKKKRAELYEKLKKSAIDDEEIKLMASSSTLGKRVSKKEHLKKLIQKERAGIALTDEEKDLLYRDRQGGDNDDSYHDDGDNENNNTNLEKGGTKSPKLADSNKKQRKDKEKTGKDSKSDKQDPAKNKQDDKNSETTPFNANSFAAQMMASLSSLKTTSEKQKEENEKKKKEKEAEQERLEEERLRKAAKSAPYKPSEPIVIQTAATNKKLQVHQLPNSSRRALAIDRPADIRESRYDLPVAQMEFEVMDAIRNHDVCIVCGETGSGKSTQIPQLLYESGYTLGSGPGVAKENVQDHKYLIGITQPRRVAAVSTAKRVCYEMGQGDGTSIKATKRGEGNLVSYQTRYETAGTGKRNSVKFMTDGILLQEIQSDLLLRKYSVIVLDECHERNLNCDILCGLIGLALPLRKKASEEPGSDIVPLKLVIMSATLRVDDFISNKKLFPSTTPFVIKVPGRTFPVTIHHSKATELDDYEEVAFEKVCKIHRQLPQGGILVFLTGKQEIVRMVNRLRKALSPKKNAAAQATFLGSSDVVMKQTDITYSNETGPRDLDDDEADGDLLFSNDDDFDDEENDEVDNEKEEPPAETETSENADDNIPKEVLVLPLYSMLSAEEQAQVFAATPENCRLIVVSTNIAETSITIPGVKYVVDSGRQKVKNYDAKTGVASFDISWISKAAANQRAGRAGRTGPGHCYRLYSSSMFSRHMDDFALPEVLTRPLEDVVLAMKAMNISCVSKFPFPTPPAESQVDAAVKLLANLGCVDLKQSKDIDGDGEATPLGAAVSTFPLGVRCGKMLLVAAHAGVLDYAIAIVAALSEKNPFMRAGEQTSNEGAAKEDEDDTTSDGEDRDPDLNQKKKAASNKWAHKGGDVYATMLAIGAYTYAGKGAGGISEKVACKQFCQENGLNHVIMERIQTIRVHLSRLVKARMAGAEAVAARTGKIPHSMKPPNKVQERLLLQVIVSGMLDNVAMLAPLGSIPGSHPFSLRSAFLSCASSIKEPLFMDRNSVIYSRDARRLPQFVCYDSLVRKNLKDGTPIATMKNVTPLDPSWLGTLAKGSNLLSLGGPLPTPRPTYDADRDEIMCSVETRFGSHNWEIPPLRMRMYDALRTPAAKNSMHFQLEDTYRYFGRCLLEGKVVLGLKELTSFLNDSPSIMTSKKPVGKVGLLVSALSEAEVDSRAKLLRHWALVDNKFLFKILKGWVKPHFSSQAKRLWIDTVKKESLPFKNM